MAEMTRFRRFELRTTDVAAARAFYAALLGEDGADIVPLPAEAAARGARAHWLGHLGVEEVERTARAFAGLGAARLGPTRPTADGGEVALVRDPGGAVVALATPPSGPTRDDVVWQVLNTGGLERCIASYRELFGWHFAERVDLGALGVFHPFAWQPGGANVGSMSDITQRPGVHPHWLFHFRVAALETALARVRAAGGVVMGPIALPGGERLAVCDDPQGAAFALWEPASGG